METTASKFNTKSIVLIGMFCAISYVVMLLSKLIPINVAGFLTFDLKDVIIAICGLISGPVPALIVSVIVSFIEMITISSTGPIGLLMNVLSTCAFVLPITLIYHKKRTFAGAIIGAVAGVLSMTAVMILWNWLITPLYMGVDRAIVISMLLPTFLPFNLLKGGINAAIMLAIYKPITTALRRVHMIPESSSSRRQKKGLSIGVTLVSLFVVVSLVLVVLVWTHMI
ncbi:MAG: ECF transporter S component [Parasporobacterium sp.]|nr:ECF transporter S component [Parasporobacterium sp.]